MPRPARDTKLVAGTWFFTRALLVVALFVVVMRNDLTLQGALSGWDAKHYIEIATQGYVDEGNRAFFPGLPLLLKALSLAGIPMPWGGVIIGLVGSLLAALALNKIGGATPAMLWLIAPTTVFTFVGYSEAAFCAAAFWAWQRALDRRWAQAAVLAAVASTFRVSGIFLIAALAVMMLFGNGVKARGRGASHDGVLPASALPKTFEKRAMTLVWLLVPVAVLVAHVAYLHHLTGSWTAWLDAQKSGWSRGFTNPVDSFKNTLDAANPARWTGRPLVGWVFAAEIASMIVGAVVTLVCLIKRRWADATFVGLSLIAFGTSHWYMSVNRAVLLWIPLFLGLGALISRTNKSRDASALRVAVGIAVVIAFVVNLWWAWLFFTGQWAS